MSRIIFLLPFNVNVDELPKPTEDLTQHLNDAVGSLQIALACDEAVKTGQTILL